MMFRDYFQDEFNQNFYALLAEKTTVEWLKPHNKSGLSSLAEIDLPFFDRHGDGYVFYVEEKSDNGFVINDDSYFLNQLFSAGCSPKTDPATWEKLDKIIADAGFTRVNYRIEKKVDYQSIPEVVYSFLNLVRVVEDMTIAKER